MSATDYCPLMIVYNDKSRTLVINNSLASTLPNLHPWHLPRHQEKLRNHELVEDTSMEEFTLILIGVWALLYWFG